MGRWNSMGKICMSLFTLLLRVPDKDLQVVNVKALA